MREQQPAVSAQSFGAERPTPSPARVLPAPWPTAARERTNRREKPFTGAHLPLTLAPLTGRVGRGRVYGV
jgi:hypothetical protein